MSTEKKKKKKKKIKKGGLYKKKFKKYLFSKLPSTQRTGRSRRGRFYKRTIIVVIEVEGVSPERNIQDR